MKKLITFLLILNVLSVMVIYNYHHKTIMMEAIIDGYCNVINGQVYCDDVVLKLRGQ